MLKSMRRTTSREDIIATIEKLRVESSWSGYSHEFNRWFPGRNRRAIRRAC